jgi:hypothetical protein
MNNCCNECNENRLETLSVINNNVLQGLERDFLLNKVYLIVRKECGYMFLLCMKRNATTQDVYNEIQEIYPEYHYNRLLFKDRNNSIHYMPNTKNINFFEWCIGLRLPSCTDKDQKMSYMCTIENTGHIHSNTNIDNDE